MKQGCVYCSPTQHGIKHTQTLADKVQRGSVNSPPTTELSYIKDQEVRLEKPEKSYAKHAVTVESLSSNFMKNSSPEKFYELTKLSGVNLKRDKILYLMPHLSGSTSKSTH